MVEKDKQNQKQMFCSWFFKIQTQIRVRCFGVTLNVRFTFKKKCPMWLNSKNSAKGKKTKIPTQHHQRLTASYYKYLAAVLAAKDGTIINC